MYQFHVFCSGNAFANAPLVGNHNYIFEFWKNSNSIFHAFVKIKFIPGMDIVFVFLVVITPIPVEEEGQVLSILVKSII